MIRAMLDTLDTRRFRSIVDVLRLAVMAGTSFYGAGSAPRIVPLSRSQRRLKPPQGLQEAARRRRQIQRGQLTVSNGLVSPMGAYCTGYLTRHAA